MKMKMKHAWMVALTLTAALAAGCSKQPAATTPTNATNAASGEATVASLPGTCVTLDQDGELAPETLNDLDGDGKPDALVVDCKAMHTCAPLLYVIRGGCGHLVGHLDSGTHPSVKVLASRSNGLADVVESLADEMTGAPFDTTYTFDGTQYVQKK
jgi:hypothetical protein